MKSNAGIATKESANAERQLDFGTYHHTTLTTSKNLRERVKFLFNEAFADLPFSQYGKLKILDIGCGLGFLSCICAQYYPNAMITGFDTFEHASLKNSSLAMARSNAKILGFSERIKFQKRDFFRSDYSKGRFDLFVSNIVFENFGNKRLEAYDSLATWMTRKSYAVLSELFFNYKTDSERLTGLFGSVRERPSKMRDSKYKMLVLSQPKN